MASQYVFIVLVSCLLLLQKTSAVSKSTLLVGEWQPLKDVKSKEVVEIGQFAVTEHNKEAKVDLQFKTVEKGAFQIVSGTNYRLVITATDHEAASSYVAEVYEDLKNTRKLTSFSKA